MVDSPTVSQESAERGTGRVPLRALYERLGRIRPELDPGSAAHSAAVLLLAAPTTGQNVDRLALFTGSSREFVARCVRRLVDNGVWVAGQRSTALDDTYVGSENFCRDVGVAEGRLCRQVDGDGHPEWALAGNCWRSLDVSSDDETGGQLVYQARQWPARAESLYQVDPQAEGSLEPSRDETGGREERPARVRGRSDWLGRGGASTPAERVEYLGEPKLFRDSRWLS